ncbi:MAG TPA: sugar phosphate nucleotidyltransferase, partial [Oscillospiraceae bacterium]|nr:sugar phosphate nucleotidyltransferase [Oscillospiraceae bacterium]
IIPYENNYIVTAASQQKKIDDVLLKEVPRENILTEPSQRNTAPCILYAALKLKKLYGDGVMCVFPSDQYITDTEEFSRIMKKAVALAEKSDKLITLGIKPTFPSTGYGYINFDASKNVDGAFSVNEFVEKPSYDKALSYIKAGTYLWNSGIFIWKISTIIENFKRYLPRIYDKMMEWYDFIGTDGERQKLDEVYPALQKISIDYGVLERSNEVLVFPADMGWNDVGSWDALGAIFPPDEDGNIIRADDHVLIDTNDCIIYSEKQLVTAINLSNMIVVSTEDALMVCPKDKAQEVKRIVDKLNEKNMQKYL